MKDISWIDKYVSKIGPKKELLQTLTLSSGEFGIDELNELVTRNVNCHTASDGERIVAKLALSELADYDQCDDGIPCLAVKIYLERPYTEEELQEAREKLIRQSLESEARDRAVYLRMKQSYGWE